MKSTKTRQPLPPCLIWAAWVVWAAWADSNHPPLVRAGGGMPPVMVEKWPCRIFSARPFSYPQADGGHQRAGRISTHSGKRISLRQTELICLITITDKLLPIRSEEQTSELQSLM